MEVVIPDLLNAVNEHLSARVGLFFNEKRYSDLERGLRVSAKELSYDDTAKCIEDLLANRLTKVQLQTIVRNLTIGETYFFRDPSVFVSLEEKLIPAIIRRKKGKRQLKIWSAGCSTGEEPFSIAISLLRSLKSLDTYDVSLLATDINTRSLEKAKKASYSSWSFRTTPDEFLSHYFNETPDGFFQLKSTLSELVKFGYLNLAEDHFPAMANNTKDVDIIFCRNVLIYFTQQKSKEIVDKLAACLSPGGILITSANDSARFIAAPPQDMERFSSTMFRKKET